LNDGGRLGVVVVVVVVVVDVVVVMVGVVVVCDADSCGGDMRCFQSHLGCNLTAHTF
jgi:hypothetical protein